MVDICEGRAACAPSGLGEEREVPRMIPPILLPSLAEHDPQRGRHSLWHAGVNAELNRITGVTKISAATVEQLQRRLDKADAWLRQASGRRVG